MLLVAAVHAANGLPVRKPHRGAVAEICFARVRKTNLRAAASATALVLLLAASSSSLAQQCKDAFPIDEVGMRLLGGVAHGAPWAIDFVDIRSAHRQPAAAAAGGALAECNCSIAVMSAVRLC